MPKEHWHKSALLGKIVEEKHLNLRAKFIRIQKTNRKIDLLLPVFDEDVVTTIEYDDQW